MERPPPGAKTTLLIVAVASALGIAGIINGIQFIRAPRPDTGSVAPGTSPAAAEADEALARAVGDVLMPKLRGLGAVDAVVSLLLAFAAFSLFLRRPQAPWWVAQAALANAAYAVVWCVVVVTTLRAAEHRLSPLVARAIDSQRAGAGHDLSPAAELSVLTLGFVLLTTLSVVFYLLIAWRVRRPDIRALMRVAESSPSE